MVLLLVQQKELMEQIFAPTQVKNVSSLKLAHEKEKKVIFAENIALDTEMVDIRKSWHYLRGGLLL
ncbi:hypothetical protein C6341_g28025 [Phytophthora cactorum]|nr:hypothetical protein C6341_g28025 [Phytophthora cactorum]